jgi:hypothetical protein
VKVLDFGLAKQTAVIHPAGVSEAPTRQKDLTAEHALVGTLQYMAPEQIEGKEIDSRTDVFAFGAVLYEMLTGRKAFSGGSPASLIAAILDSEPPVPESPPRLGEILKRCLAKSPEERWQSLRDVSALLGWIGKAGDDDRAPISKRSWVAPLAAGFALAALVGTTVWLLRPQPTPRVVRLTADLPPDTILGSAVDADRIAAEQQPAGRHLEHQRVEELQQQEIGVRGGAGEGDALSRLDRARIGDRAGQRQRRLLERLGLARADATDADIGAVREQLPMRACARAHDVHRK